MIKWLSRISVTSEESDSFYHYHDNRVLPTPVDSAETANVSLYKFFVNFSDFPFQEGGWWYKPDYILNELNINSAASSPAHEEKIQITLDQDSKISYTFKGYCYTGGGRKIIRMEISFDSGKSWKLTTLHPYPKPAGDFIPGKGGKKDSYLRHRGTRNWCWSFWSYTVEDFVEILLGNGKNIKLEHQWLKEICFRALDDGQNVQPDKPTWNLMGMFNNPWFRVRSHITVSKSENGVNLLEVEFEHPTTVDPNSTSGWMRMGEENSWYLNSIEPKKIEIAEEVVKKEIEVKKWIKMSEVKQHNKEDDCWVVLSGIVYDCTPFLAIHPGGSESIVLTAGTDATEEFNAIHSQKAHDMLVDYYIGHLQIETEKELKNEGEIENNGLLIDPKQYKPLVLSQRINLSHDIRLFRFKLPVSEKVDETGERQTSGLLPGQHVYVKCTEVKESGEKAMAIRAYTPISIDTLFQSDHGYLDLLIKIYFPIRGHPIQEMAIGGKMTVLLEQLKEGDTAEFKGPMGHIVYLGNSRFSIAKSHIKLPGVKTQYSRIVVRAERVSFLAAGTGITPCWQVIRTSVHEHQRAKADELKISEPRTDKRDFVIPKPPRVWLLYANRQISDVMLKNELDDIARSNTDSIRVQFTLTGSSPKTWVGITGRPDETMIRSYLAPSSERFIPVLTNEGEDEEWDVGSIMFLCGPDAMVENYTILLKNLGFKHGQNLFVF
ncbi:hypothetical protein HK096_010633 [Nowakowskiella sp. JEL0078]|nr:hypothetical protein HK096_010633 [Nowakowskiella sp. JEL0078]